MWLSRSRSRDRAQEQSANSRPCNLLMQHLQEFADWIGAGKGVFHEGRSRAEACQAGQSEKTLGHPGVMTYPFPTKTGAGR